MFKTRILFINRYVDLFLGIGKSGYYLIKGLKERNLDIFLVSPTIKSNNFVKVTLNMFLILKRYFNKKCDVVYVHNQDDILPSLFYLLKYPTIICIHDIIPLIIKERKFFYNLYLKISLLILKFLVKHRKIVIITPSKTSKRDLVLFGFPKNRIVVIYWGVDHNLYKPIIHIKEKKLNRKEIILGYIGTFPKKGSRKNVDMLIEAYLELRNKYKNVILYLAGKYPQWFMEKYVDKYKHDITFLGFLPEEKVPEFYNEIDILVYPSSYEGLGMQILEAISCGTLVLASDIPAFRELLPKDLLFKLDKESLIRKIEGFLDKNKIERYSNMLFETSKKFDWDASIEKYISILSKLLNKYKNTHNL